MLFLMRNFAARCFAWTRRDASRLKIHQASARQSFPSPSLMPGLADEKFPAGGRQVIPFDNGPQGENEFPKLARALRCAVWLGWVWRLPPLCVGSVASRSSMGEAGAGLGSGAVAGPGPSPGPRGPGTGRDRGIRGGGIVSAPYRPSRKEEEGLGGTRPADRPGLSTWRRGRYWQYGAVLTASKQSSRGACSAVTAVLPGAWQ